MWYGVGVYIDYFVVECVEYMCKCDLGINVVVIRFGVVDYCDVMVGKCCYYVGKMF